MDLVFSLGEEVHFGLLGVNTSTEVSSKIRLVTRNEQLPSKWERSFFIYTSENCLKEIKTIIPSKIFQDTVVFIPFVNEGNSGERCKDWEEMAVGYSDMIMFWLPSSTSSDDLERFLLTFRKWASSGKVVYGHDQLSFSRETSSSKISNSKKLFDEIDNLALSEDITIHCSIQQCLEYFAEKTANGAMREGAERKIPLHVWKHPTFKDWYANTKKDGSRLDDATLKSAVCLGPNNVFTLYWVVKVFLWLALENRHRTDEIVLARNDIKCVFPFYVPEGKKNATEFDCEVVLIKEFRSPTAADSTFIHALFGESAFKAEDAIFEDEDSQTKAKQEVNMVVADSARMRDHGTRLIAGSTSSHLAHLFSIQLTKEEIEACHQFISSHVTSDMEDNAEKEEPFVVVIEMRNILKSNNADWSMLGMIHYVLQDALNNNAQKSEPQQLVTVKPKVPESKPPFLSGIRKPTSMGSSKQITPRGSSLKPTIDTKQSKISTSNTPRQRTDSVKSGKPDAALTLAQQHSRKPSEDAKQKKNRTQGSPQSSLKNDKGEKGRSPSHSTAKTSENIKPGTGHSPRSSIVAVMEASGKHELEPNTETTQYKLPQCGDVSTPQQSPSNSSTQAKGGNSTISDLHIQQSQEEANMHHDGAVSFPEQRMLIVQEENLLRREEHSLEQTMSEEQQYQNEEAPSIDEKKIRALENEIASLAEQIFASSVEESNDTDPPPVFYDAKTPEIKQEKRIPIASKRSALKTPAAIPSLLKKTPKNSQLSSAGSKKSSPAQATQGRQKDNKAQPKGRSKKPPFASLQNPENQQQKIIRAIVRCQRGFRKRRAQQHSKFCVFNCPGLHGLKLTAIAIAINAATTPFTCNICQKASPNSLGAMTCSLCNYDVCPACFYTTQTQEIKVEMDEDKTPKDIDQTAFHKLVGAKKKVLVLGMGGGCDILMAYFFAKQLNKDGEGTGDVLFANCIFELKESALTDHLTLIPDALFAVPPGKPHILVEDDVCAGTTLLEQSVPRGAQNSPLLIQLKGCRQIQSDEQLQELAVENSQRLMNSFDFLGVDLVVGVDCGGHRAKDEEHALDFCSGRDQQILGAFREYSKKHTDFSFICVDVALGPCCDSQTREQYLATEVLNQHEPALDGRLKLWAGRARSGSMTTDPLIQNYFPLETKLDENPTPFLMYQALIENDIKDIVLQRANTSEESQNVNVDIVTISRQNYQVTSRSWYNLIDGLNLFSKLTCDFASR